MIQSAVKVPDELVERDEPQRIHNYLAFPSFCDGAPATPNQDQFKSVLAIHKLQTLTQRECQDLGVPESEWFSAFPDKDPYNPLRHLAWALSLFRMRVRMTQDIDALIVFGGKDDGKSWGRFSGVAEEVMLALAFNKPVYVLGEFDGAAQAVGQLLGLDKTLVNPDTCLVDNSGIEFSSLYKSMANAFTLPGHPNLPRTMPEVRNYLFNHSVITDSWPWNGLKIAENRKLFAKENTPEEQENRLKLIIQGLTRLDWKHPASSRKKLTPGT